MIKKIGNTGNGKSQSRTVYSVDGICPTLVSGMDKGNTIPYIVKRLGNIYGATGGSYAGAVYDDKGLSPCIDSMSGGNRQPMIVVGSTQKNAYVGNGEYCPSLTSAMGEGGGQVPMIVAMRGRNPDNPSDRMPGIELEQRLEANQEGICNTLTSVNKDNLVLIKQATKRGYIECKVGGVADLSYPDSKTRRGRVQDSGDTSPTLTAGETDICKIESPYRIRKLTPLECWRLMGFTDEEFKAAETVNSNTQLYKQAGNSIVVDVLVGIFRNIIKALEVEEMKKVEETKTIKFETDKMIDLAKLQEKEPELFEELVKDYPCEEATYIYEVKNNLSEELDALPFV